MQHMGSEHWGGTFKLWLGRMGTESDDKLVLELRELCLSKLHLIYIICISSCLVYLLVRNVMTHSPCVVCVWIL